MPSTVIDLATKFRKKLKDGTVVESSCTLTPLPSPNEVGYIVHKRTVTTYPDGKTEEDEWWIPKKYLLQGDVLLNWTLLGDIWVPENPLSVTHTAIPTYDGPNFDSTIPDAEPPFPLPILQGPMTQGLQPVPKS